jgi:hypothetical protein
MEYDVHDFATKLGMSTPIFNKINQDVTSEVLQNDEGQSYNIFITGSSAGAAPGGDPHL